MSVYESERSNSLYEQACGLMPGGVNSPVRAFRAVGGTPVYFERGEGCRLYDVDGNAYIDYVSSWGAIIAGHANADINRSIADAAANGASFGAPHAGEIRLASEVIDRMPAVERVRFVNSGTEAALAVVRLVRAATGRTKIVKFEGNYHGAIDPLLSKAGSGIATFGLPDSAGVPKEAASGTLTATYNDLTGVETIFGSNPGEIAAVIVEPVAGNMGLVPPEPGFLEGLRRLCDQHGALLVLDEVMTGFRVARGGASERYGVRPDLVMMGKVIGGGLPVGAYGGRKDLMEMVAPLGPMYQAGTLSGNPLAMAAGLAALEHLTPGVYEELEQMGSRLETGLNGIFSERGVPAQVQRIGSMISVFLTASPVRNFGEAGTTDKALFGKLFHALLRRGVYLPPSALEAWFLNSAHGEQDIDQTLDAVRDALAEVTA
ncbi:MAG: glutamate-1-semialdehyde 2,1-aminomutase [Armatimonadetes bacterium]|nr:glutamate-1-semialdehyde 2,1-aminomutase [Armatimonadota bacterium]